MSSDDSTVTQGAGSQLVKRTGRYSENSSPVNGTGNGGETGYFWRDHCYPFKGVLGEAGISRDKLYET